MMPVAQSPDDLLLNLQVLKPSDATRSFRRQIIEDFPGDRCCYCGRPATKWTLDHIIPKSKGGPTRRWNLARCCSHCNGNKSNSDMLPWFRPQRFWLQHREETLFDWMRYNSDIDIFNQLEEAMREGEMDSEALMKMCDATAPEKSDSSTEDYWDRWCSINPSEPECLVYDV